MIAWYLWFFPRTSRSCGIGTTFASVSDFLYTRYFRTRFTRVACLHAVVVARQTFHIANLAALLSARPWVTYLVAFMLVTPLHLPTNSQTVGIGDMALNLNFRLSTQALLCNQLNTGWANLMTLELANMSALHFRHANFLAEW
jgi:hypothetical protein